MRVFASRGRERKMGKVMRQNAMRRKVIGVSRGPVRSVGRSRKGTRWLSRGREQQQSEETELRLVDPCSGATEVWRERRIFIGSSYGCPGVWVPVSGVLVCIRSVDGSVRRFG